MLSFPCDLKLSYGNVFFLLKNILLHLTSFVLLTRRLRESHRVSSYPRVANDSNMLIYFSLRERCNKIYIFHFVGGSVRQKDVFVVVDF